jgi:hypothetical protein
MSQVLARSVGGQGVESTSAFGELRKHKEVLSKRTPAAVDPVRIHLKAHGACEMIHKGSG